jgi:hypothetical protein
MSEWKLASNSFRFYTVGPVMKTSAKAQPTAYSRLETKYKELSVECARLRADIELLRELLMKQSKELQIQFTRIAEMQATLDGQRKSEAGYPTPAPVYRKPFKTS